MSQTHELRAYDYVNRPYGVVRDALRTGAVSIFERATKGATHRAESVAAKLSVELAGLEVGTDVSIKVMSIEEREGGKGRKGPSTVLKLEWKAVRAAAIFPSMEAELSVYPLSPQETQLDLHGLYRPPLGVLGGAIDSLAGHRVAEASVHRFVSDIAALLKSDLPAS